MQLTSVVNCFEAGGKGPTAPLPPISLFTLQSSQCVFRFVGTHAGYLIPFVDVVFVIMCFKDVQAFGHTYVANFLSWLVLLCTFDYGPFDFRVGVKFLVPY